MPNDNLLNVYQQLCNSYQEIDSFRAQLLGRLPLATGAGIFLLYATNGDLPQETKNFLPAIGLFGFVVTLGLFAYEIYGIKKCHALILGGKQLEYQLGIEGQFAHRPRSVLSQINEPFAAGVIYPAVLAAWAFLAFAFIDPNSLRWGSAIVVFLIGLASLLNWNSALKKDGELADLIFVNQCFLQAEEKGDWSTLSPFLADDFKQVDASGKTQNRFEFLKTLPHDANLNHSVDQIKAKWDGKHAEFTCRVTTHSVENGEKDQFNLFWITRHFIRECEQNGDHWLCTDWQVTEILDRSSQ